MTTDDDTMRRFITCSECGCLIETSYYATHTGCCPGKGKSKPWDQLPKKGDTSKDYWR